MNDYAALLLEKYRARGVLIDTNLLLVYLIGSFDRTLFGRLSRLENYSEADFDLLVRLVAQFPAIVTTPHILTEVSNLAMNAVYRNKHEDLLAQFSAMIKLLVEESLASAQLSDKPLFIQFGIADTAIEHLSRDKYLVVSDDLRFVARLESEGVDVLNFNHIRTLAWQ